MAESILKKADERGLAVEELMGARVNLPGAVYDNGRLGTAPNVFITGGRPADEVSSRLKGMKTVALNDADSAALGEMWMGAGSGYKSLCMVTMGTGVGGGIVQDGRVILGQHGAGGEIGHLKVEQHEAEACNCGGYGCCEFYASATGIVRVAKRIVANGDPLTPVMKGHLIKYPESKLAKFGNQLTAKDVCEIATAEDKLALEALNFSMDKLGQALSLITYVTDPEVFVIGGGVAAAGDFLLNMIRENLLKYTPLIKEKERYIIPAKLGNDAGIYGAVCAVMQAK